MRQSIYKREEAFEEFCYNHLVKTLTFFTIYFIIITIIVMNIGNKEIYELEQILEKESTLTENEIERIPFEEMIDSYISSLPISKQKIEIIEQYEKDEIEEIELKDQVNEIVPNVSTFNTSAYCKCEKCCGKTDGITKSGKIASQWCTIAASGEYEFGTIIYIPSLSNEPNKGWFVVEDRGGAIKGNKLDIFFDSHQAALEYGRKDMTVYVYEF